MVTRRDFAAAFALSFASRILPAARAAATSLPSAAAAINPPAATFQADLPHLMAIAEVPGIAVSVVHGRRVVWQYQHGVADINTARPVSADTLWPAASLSKPVFALAALRLADDGRLDLDRPLKSYLPDHAPDDPRGDRITARHVLSHSSGLRNWREGPDDRLVPDFEPGSRFQYSGEGYVYLQRVVEHIAGVGFERFMRERLFTPLGMTSSTYLWRQDVAERVVAGHDRGRAYQVFWRDLATRLLTYAGERGRALDGFTYEDIRTAVKEVAPDARTLPQFLIPNAASSLLTTLSDYSAYLIALLSEGPAQIALKPETRRTMLTAQIRINSALGWGLGLGIEAPASRAARATGGRRGADLGFVWQWGDNGSWKNLVLAHPASGSAVVVFTNGSRGLNLAQRIVGATTGLAHDLFLWL
jgi:CubicO group peptidase (beta-lactamase class C family)